jgi:ribosomal protein S18 acetylase RimI-like enzyme
VQPAYGCAVAPRVRRIRSGETAEVRRLRLAMLEDAPEAFHTRYEDEAAQDDAFWEERTLTGALAARAATFVAADGDRHFGSVTGLRPDDDEPALLVAMWVEPAARHAGWGAQLVEAVCRWARRQGSSSIELDVRELNAAAIDLYRRCGFEVFSGPAPAPGNPELMELRMRRRLDVPPDGPVVQRLRRAHAGLAEGLAALPGADLHSLLLHETRRRAAGATPPAVLRARLSDELAAPVPIDAVALQRAGLAALEVAEGFEPVTLSPVAPAGVNTALGGVDQNLSVATVRGTEVLSDPTTALALEAALRRRAGDRSPALCWVGRVLRTQPFGAGSYQHFGLFALVSAGLREPGHGFALRALAAHLRTYLTLADRVGAGPVVVETTDTAWLAVRCRDAGVDLSDLVDQERLGAGEPEQLLHEAGIDLPRFTTDPPPGSELLARVAATVYADLAAAFPTATLGFRPGRLVGAAYYTGLLLNIDCERPGGRLSLADGGATDWTQRLLSNRRERLFVSGVGLDRLVRP